MTAKRWHRLAWGLVLLVAGCSGRLAPSRNSENPDNHPPDGGSDTVAPDGLRRSLDLIHARDDAFRLRERECLNVPGHERNPYDYPSDTDLEPSLGFGLLAIDESAMAECMALLQGSSCEDIAALAGATDLAPPTTWMP